MLLLLLLLLQLKCEEVDKVCLTCVWVVLELRIAAVLEMLRSVVFGLMVV